MKVRFAPSPTGNLHIGSVRTALFNWVYAQKYGAGLVLRIEDTDISRSKSEYEDNIMEGLNWLGLTMDESPLTPLEDCLYRQSQRMDQDIYLQKAKSLIDSGYAYYSFETEEELEQERASAKARGEAYVYSGKSRLLSPEQIRSNLDSGMPYTIRFYIGEPQSIVVNDLIRGDIDFDTSLLSDFIIIKSDGSPSYNFAVVVDDYDMGITHVIRGEDHISNTPRQILVYKALGAVTPKFAHLPIILGKDKSKLSKRDGAVAVTDYRDQGYLPDALLNYLSLLGWSPEDGRELLSRDELISQFDISRISKSGAVFDEKKLKWMNGQYIRQHSPEQLLDLVKPFLSSVSVSAISSFSTTLQVQMIQSIQDNLELLSEVNHYLELYVISEEKFKERLAEFSFSEQDQRVLLLFASKLSSSNCSRDDVESAMQAICDEEGLGKGKVFKPIRIATTSYSSGPYLPDALSVFGLDRVLKRLSLTIQVDGYGQS